MTKRAPECRHDGCGNTTWLESGLCHVHQSAVSHNQKGSPVPSSVVAMSTGPRFVNREDLSREMADVFPDMEEVSVESLHHQSEISIRSAVSIEVYRVFGKCDHPDPEQRNVNLVNAKWELVEMNQVTPVTFTNDDAVLLSNSSQDMYGRSMEDSMALASYGLRREWDLARSMGRTSDPDGVSYGNDFDRYCDARSEITKNIISDEFDRQMVHYPRIMKESTGSYPASQQPLLPGQEMSPQMPPDRVLPRNFVMPEPKRPVSGRHVHRAPEPVAVLAEPDDSSDHSSEGSTAGSAARSFGKGLLKAGIGLGREYSARKRNVEEARESRRDREMMDDMAAHYRASAIRRGDRWS